MVQGDDPDDPAEQPTTQDGKRANYISERIEKDFAMVDHLNSLVTKALATATDGSVNDAASAYHQPLPDQSAAKAKITEPNSLQASRTKKDASVYVRNYKQAYTSWSARLK